MVLLVTVSAGHLFLHLEQAVLI
jgi:hypothetical protein